MEFMEPELIDVFEQDIDFASSSSSEGVKSVRFGDGVELLMNHKRSKNSSQDATVTSIDLDDLDTLEKELNDLTANSKEPAFFNFSSGGLDSDAGASANSGTGSAGTGSAGTGSAKTGTYSHGESIGKSTAELNNDHKTWDGYGKFSNIPPLNGNPGTFDASSSASSPPPQPTSKEEAMREKFKLLKRLEQLEKKGVELSKKYNMDSSMVEMQCEYETIMDEKYKKNSIKFQSNILLGIVNVVENVNRQINPFDIDLNGWSDQVNENVDDYEEIFGELFEKYKSKGSLAPELKLLLQMGGSAMMVHMSNSIFKTSSLPGMDDILRQNPDLMRQFQAAAVNSMSQSHPQTAGFMQGIMQNQKTGPPPPPMATQSFPPPAGRPGNNSFSQASDLNLKMTRPEFEKTSIPFDAPQKSQRPLANGGGPLATERKEMKGPSDISSILSGLKTKTINIDSQTYTPSQQPKDDFQAPKKSRKPRSNKNTVSLDI